MAERMRRFPPSPSKWSLRLWPVHWQQKRRISSRDVFTLTNSYATVGGRFLISFRSVSQNGFSKNNNDPNDLLLLCRILYEPMRLYQFENPRRHVRVTGSQLMGATSAHEVFVRVFRRYSDPLARKTGRDIFFCVQSVVISSANTRL